MTLLGGFDRTPHREAGALEVPLALADGLFGGPRGRSRRRPQVFVAAGRDDAAREEPRPTAGDDGRAQQERERHQHSPDWTALVIGIYQGALYIRTPLHLLFKNTQHFIGQPNSGCSIRHACSVSWDNDT